MARAGTMTLRLAPTVKRPFGLSAAGVVLSALLHVTVLGIFVTTAHQAIVEQREAAERKREMEAPPAPPFSFVPARLLKLGNQDPTETAMPQREVPALPTAPPEPEVNPQLAPDPDSATSGPRPVRRRNPLEIEPRRVQQRPRRAAPSNDVNAIWDRLRQDFPEQGGWSRVQGFPDGDPNGTELDRSLVRPGDWYATELMQFFQDRWSIPSMLTAAQIRRLSCKVRIALDAGFRIIDYEMVLSSRNDRYDNSVLEVLRKLQQDRTPLPAIPSQVRDHIINNGLILVWKP